MAATPITAETIATVLLGRRALLSMVETGWGYSPGSVNEFRIIELSPSGAYVKLMNANGLKFWKLTSNVLHVETLADPAEPRPTHV